MAAICGGKNNNKPLDDHTSDVYFEITLLITIATSHFFYAIQQHTANTTAAHYANTQIARLYLNGGNLFQSQPVYINARRKYAGGFGV